MKSPEYIIHGTSSKEDAESIEKAGFEALEGRATVSTDLIYAFDWATNLERRSGSKSEAEVQENEKGKIIIMKVPEDKSVDYATHTSIEVDESSKKVTGYSSKYESGRKQLAIYNENEVVDKRKQIEQAKQELKKIESELSNFLSENNVNPEQIKSKDDFLEAIKDLDTEKKIEILKKAEEFEGRIAEKKKEAEPDVFISPENVLMSIIPTLELGEKLQNLQQRIKNLETVDIENFVEEVSKIIEENKENFLASGLDVREIIGNLVRSTMEAEIVNMIRTLSVNVKRAQGYEIYNRGEEELKEKEIDKMHLLQKLEKIKSIVESENFDIGMENLNRYLRLNIGKLLGELK